MKPVLKFVADILHGNKAFDAAAQKSIVEQCEMKEMADICGDTSRLGLPMSENTSLKEETQQAMGDLNSIKDAFVELINHWEWENTDKHGLDVFDERCFAMWRALATVRDPMPLHGLLDDIPPHGLAHRRVHSDGGGQVLGTIRGGGGLVYQVVDGFVQNQVDIIGIVDGTICVPRIQRQPPRLGRCQPTVAEDVRLLGWTTAGVPARRYRFCRGLGLCDDLRAD